MIYLDNAATTFQKPKQVYQVTVNAMQKYGANAGRGGYKLSIAAAERIAECEDAVAALFHISDPMRIAFAQNTTMALNMAIKGIVTGQDHVIMTSMEHNSAYRPVMKIAGDRSTIVWGDDRGYIQPKDVEAAIRPNTKLIVCNHASNVCGSIQDVAAIGGIARKHGVVFLVDAAQSGGVLNIDVEAMNIDLLAFAGHKGLFGPQGTGGLYIRKGIELDTIMEGGTGSESEKVDQPLFLPDRFQSGTINAPALAGLRAGIQYIQKIGVGAVYEHEMRLTKMLMEGLLNINGIKLYGSPDIRNRVGVVSVRLAGMDPVEVCEILDSDYDIAARCGLHCAPLAHKTIGTLPGGTVRFSPGLFNTTKDIHTLLSAINRISKK